MVSQYSTAPPRLTAAVQFNCNDAFDATSVNITLVVSEITSRTGHNCYDSEHFAVHAFLIVLVDAFLIAFL